MMEQIEIKEQFLYALARLELQELLALRMQAVIMLMNAQAGHRYGQPMDRKFDIRRLVLPGFEAFREEPEDSGELMANESHGLTEREREVASLVVEGLSNADIAARLFVSEATVKKHLRAVYSKLRIKNRVQLIKAYLH